MSFSSLRLDLDTNGYHYKRTIPLPLRSLVSTTLYESFASEIDALVVAKFENESMMLVPLCGGMFGIFLFVAGSALWSYNRIGFIPGIIILILGTGIFGGSVIRLEWLGFCTNQLSFTTKVKQVCEDYSRRFGTITLHYKEEVSYDRTSDGDTLCYIEVRYPNDLVPTAEGTPVLVGAVVLPSSPMIEVRYPNDLVPTAEGTPVLVEAVALPSSPMEADIAFSKTAKEEYISRV